jgi:hypothetical protein
MPSVGDPLWQPGILRTPSVALSRRASQVSPLPHPLPLVEMPRALQLWLPQPCLRVRGQASGSSAGEKGGICGWQCFPDCGRNRDNNNASTTVNAITMTRPGCPQQRRRPRRRRKHHHDSCESYMKHVLSQRNLRQCSCSKQRCSEVWLTRSFSGRGDDLITSLLARVALLYL